MNDLLDEVKVLFPDHKVYEHGGFGQYLNVTVDLDGSTKLCFSRNYMREVSCYLRFDESVFDPLHTECRLAATAAAAWATLQIKLEQVTTSYLDDLRYIRRICDIG